MNDRKMSRKIPLTQGQFAIVDDENYEWLNHWKWYAKKDFHTYYAVRNIGKNPHQQQVYMHRVIMKAPPNQRIDHKRNNGLDNRKSSLRFCTNAQNQFNQQVLPDRGTSIYKGVSLRKDCNKWVSQIVHKRKIIFLGFFDEEIEAAQRYDDEAKELFGEFARLNFGR